MRVLFLEVDTERSWAVASIGPGFLASYLRAHGHEAAFLRATVDMTDAQVVAAIGRPDLLALSLTTRQWQRARRLVAQLPADLPVIAGGLHPTFSPEEVLAEPGFDFVCLGEGEEALRELCDGNDPAGIANLWVKGGARPPLRPPFEPIDDLPFLARDVLDEPPGTVHMCTQRGCPFPCTYCAARIYSELYEGYTSYGRRRSAENVLAELRALDPAYVIFLDDTFTINHRWVKDFCRLYKAELGRPFSLHARVETVSAPMLELLADAGCAQITYGVESGSERIRREVMKRPVTNDRFREVFAATRDAGILLTANFMLGVPGETRADLQMTLDLAEELRVVDFGYFVFYPYPGTALFRTCRENGYLPDDYLGREANHRESILTLPHITNDDIGEFYDAFTALRARLYAERGGLDHVAELARTG